MNYVEYQGRMVKRHPFRAFIYSLDGKRKLVESYEDFQNALGSGLWFESLDAIKSLNESQITAKEVIDEIVEEKATSNSKHKSAKKNSK